MVIFPCLKCAILELAEAKAKLYGPFLFRVHNRSKGYPTTGNRPHPCHSLYRIFIRDADTAVSIVRTGGPFFGGGLSSRGWTAICWEYSTIRFPALGNGVGHDGPQSPSPLYIPSDKALILGNISFLCLHTGLEMG